MPVIDRYFFKDLITVYLICLLTLVSFYVSVDLISHFARYDFPWQITIGFYLYKVPTVVVQMMTVSTFLAVLITYSGFSKNLELVAMSSSGISSARIFAPAISLAFAIMTAHMLLTDQWATRTFMQYRHLRNTAHNPNSALKFTAYGYKENNIWFRFENKFYNILTTNNEGTSIYGVSIYETSPDFFVQRRVQAEEAAYADGAWTLRRGKEFFFTDKNHPPTIVTFDVRPIDFKARPSEIKEVMPQTMGMRISELKRFIERNKRSGVDYSRMSVEFQSRVAFSFACIIFTLLALPFCTKSTRHHNIAKNIGICFLFIVVYWSFFTFFVSLGHSQSLPPFLAAWGANLIYGGIAAALLYKKGAIR